MSPRRGSSLPPELPSRTDEVSSANDIDQFEDYEHNERKAGQENDSDNVILVSDLPEKQTPSKNFDASLGAQREESKKNMVVMSTIDEGASITAQNSVSDNDTCENKTGSYESHCFVLNKYSIPVIMLSVDCLTTLFIFFFL